MSWEFVVDMTRCKGMDICKASRLAANLGYKFILFNDQVKLLSVTREGGIENILVYDTGLKRKDLR